MKVEQLEFKITQEMQTLREKIDKMTSELVIFSDIGKLKADAEARKKVCVSLSQSIPHLYSVNSDHRKEDRAVWRAVLKSCDPGIRLHSNSWCVKLEWKQEGEPKFIINSTQTMLFQFYIGANISSRLAGGWEEVPPSLKKIWSPFGTSL